MFGLQKYEKTEEERREACNNLFVILSDSEESELSNLLKAQILCSDSLHAE